MSVEDFTMLRADVVTAGLEAEREAAREQKLNDAKAKRASGRKQQANPLPPPPTPQCPLKPSAEEQQASREQEQAQKQRLLDKIGKYKSKFPDLSQRNKVSVKSSIEELQDELHYIEEQLGEPTDMEDNYMGLGLVTAMYGAEYVTENHFNPLNLDLSGLGDTVKINLDKFEPLLEELAIKYNTQMSVSVEMRLMMLLGTTVMTVHAANKGMNFPSKIMTSLELEQQEAEVTDKYAQL